MHASMASFVAVFMLLGSIPNSTAVDLSEDYLTAAWEFSADALQPENSGQPHCQLPETPKRLNRPAERLPNQEPFGDSVRSFDSVSADLSRDSQANDSYEFLRQIAIVLDGVAITNREILRFGGYIGSQFAAKYSGAAPQDTQWQQGAINGALLRYVLRRTIDARLLDGIDDPFVGLASSAGLAPREPNQFRDDRIYFGCVLHIGKKPVVFLPEGTAAPASEDGRRRYANQVSWLTFAFNGAAATVSYEREIRTFDKLQDYFAERGSVRPLPTVKNNGQERPVGRLAISAVCGRVVTDCVLPFTSEMSPNLMSRLAAAVDEFDMPAKKSAAPKRAPILVRIQSPELVDLMSSAFAETEFDETAADDGNIFATEQYSIDRYSIGDIKRNWLLAD